MYAAVPGVTPATVRSAAAAPAPDDATGPAKARRVLQIAALLLGQPEIEDLDLLHPPGALVDKDVRRLDVPVNDALGMRGRQRRRHLPAIRN